MSRAAWKRWVLDYDQPCPNCGYNLRGLRPSQPCPECGKDIPDYSLRDERYMLHRAGKPYLKRLVLGADAMLLTAAAVSAAFVIAGAIQAPAESIQIGVLAASVAWGAAWQCAASRDAVEPANSPNNAAARTTRLTAAIAASSTCVVAFVHLFDVASLLSRYFSADIVILLGFALYLFTALAVLAHFGTAMSYYELVVYRARRLVPERRKGLLWWTIPLAILVLPLTPFVVSFLLAWRLRRAGTAARRAAG